MVTGELEKRARAVTQTSVSGKLSIIYLNFRNFSNLVPIIHNRLEIGSCFLDQMQFSLEDILIENGLFRVAKEGGG